MADIAKKIKTKTNEIVEKIKVLPREKQIAYGSITLGLFFILLSIIFW